MSHRPAISEFESTTLIEDGRDQHGTSFYSGIPEENAVDTSRLAERALLQGAKSGLLDDRVAVDGELDTDKFK